MPLLVFGLLLLSPWAVAQDIYRCTVDGQLVYQHAPCGKGGEARKLEIHDQKLSAVDAYGQREKLLKDAAAVDQRNKACQLEREIAYAEAEITGPQKAMEAELEQLRKKKALAANNLAGAT